MPAEPVNLLAPIVMIGLATGCVTPGKSIYDYTPPDTGAPASNSRTVDQPFDATWDVLISSLSGSFFVINNLSKESGLINLSYSTSDPEDFVDCGTTERTFKYREENASYLYDPAEDSQYKVAKGVPTNRTIVASVQRNTNLEGRINVYVREISPGRTRVRVNTRYVLSVTVSGTQRLYSPVGVLQDSQSVNSSSTTPISFNTGSKGKENWGPANDPTYVECVATGNLEKRVLSSL